MCATMPGLSSRHVTHLFVDSVTQTCVDLTAEIFASEVIQHQFYSSQLLVLLTLPVFCFRPVIQSGWKSLFTIFPTEEEPFS